MADNRGEYSEREERLGEIVFAYIQALENGQPPCRRQILAEHPEFADELQEFFLNRDRVNRCAGSFQLVIRQSAAGDQPPDDATLGFRGETVTLAAKTSCRSVGNYELLEELGRGGMGVVFKARQKSLSRLVALKMIRLDRLVSNSDMQRFRQEAEAIARLDHPHIAPIYEIGKDGEHHYFTMKLLEGGGLDQWPSRLLGEPEVAVRLMVSVAEAICHAHRRGILHRDLKPSNVLLDRDGHPYVVDFGLAKYLEVDSTLTKTGDFLGTPSYMAPELVLRGNAAVTAASDLYGLGAMLYFLLTGRPPFRGVSVLDTFDQIAHSDPTPPRQSNPRVDRDLQTICLKCLDKEPLRRYACAGELVADLRRYLAGAPVLARSITTTDRIWRWCKRFPLAAGLAAATALLLVAVLVSLVASNWRISHAYREAEEARQKAAAKGELARKLQADAEHRERVVCQYLHAANIRLAHLAWKNADLPRMRRLLAACRPAAGQPDLRGFEWFYLWQLAHGERCTLRGHTGEVYSVRFSPDGRTLASAGQDGTIRLWDASTGQAGRVLTGHEDEINGIAYSPDGALLASASDDRTVRLWEVASGELRATFAGHTAPVFCVAFSPDNRWLASGGKDKSVRLWDPQLGSPHVVLEGHQHYVESLTFTPDGKTLATSAGDGAVTWWDIDGLTEQATLHPHKRSVLSVAFSHNGQQMANASEDETISLWSVTSKERLAELRGHKSWVQCVVFSPDDRLLASAGKDGTVRMWNLERGDEQERIRGHEGRVWCVAFSPDGKSLATSGADRTVKLWDLPASQDRKPLPLYKDYAGGLAFSPDGKQLATCGPRLFEVASRREVVTNWQEVLSAKSVTFTPDSALVVAGTLDGRVALLDPSTGSVTADLGQHGDGILAVAVTSDGHTLATSSLRDPDVVLWDIRRRARLATLRGHTGGVRPLAFSADGMTLASGGTDNMIRLWDVAAGRERNALPVAATPHVIAFHPDGHTLAVAAGDRTLRLLDTRSQLEGTTLLGHTDAVWAAAFSPDGSRLASGASDRSVKLWDVASRQELLSLDHPGPVWCLAFSPDGRMLASGGEAVSDPGEVVYLWLAADPQQVP